MQNGRWRGMAGVGPGVLMAVASLASCKPATIAEAEARGDVAWLQQNDTPPAVDAIGRLADRDPAAASALDARSGYDLEAFRAAWAAVLRGAPWGTAMLHGALGDPSRADVAASAMGKRDVHLVPFLADLEEALVRISASPQNVNVSSTLASIGAPARAAIERRLADASTRGPMCTGITSPQAADAAHTAFISVPESSRDAPACVDAAVVVAADDEAALGWLAESGEPGLLGAAGKSDAMPCARLHMAWARAFTARPATDYPALTVPLGYAVKRCPAQMDGVLADAIARLPGSHGVVVQAIDPFTTYGDALHATCAALPTVASGRDTAVVRERASDALAHACRAPG